MAADSSFSSSTTSTTSSSLLLDAMDHLWFHHIILFSEPSSLKPVLSTPASKSSSNSCQISSISEEENMSFLGVHTNSSSSNTTIAKQDTGLFDEQEFEKEKESRSNSSSPSFSHKKRLKNNVKGGNGMFRLKKTMSCKSLCELELEEVKGFMDLGFRFSKDHLISKRMMSLIPGLQRLEDPFFKIEEKDILKDEEEEERCHKIRPYLSEVWLIKRTDSPLLNLRIPRVSTAADMKKHLKYWAKTVACAIQQDS